MTIYSKNLVLTCSGNITDTAMEDANLVLTFIERVLPATVSCIIIDAIIAQYGNTPGNQEGYE